jgi:hypothetical protein
VISFCLPQFSQFARTIGDSAARARSDLGLAYKQFAETITASGETADAKWPFYTMHLYQHYADKFLTQSRTELVSLRNLVKADEVDDWLVYAASHYEDMYVEAHNLKFGDLSRLKPENYKDFVWRRTPDGVVLPDIERDCYFPTWTTSPPGRDYSSLHWNIASHPGYEGVIAAVLKLKNETLVTKIQDYAGPAKAYLVKEEHDRMHDPLPPGETTHPHSFFFHPVRERLNDPDAAVVAVLGGGAPWDQGLRGLIPVGVNGIVTVIENNCGDVFTYEINGPVASFLGSKDLHDEQYEKLKYEVDLSFHTHPDYAATPGHCQYKMVRS